MFYYEHKSRNKQQLIIITFIIVSALSIIFKREEIIKILLEYKHDSILLLGCSGLIFIILKRIVARKKNENQQEGIYRNSKSTSPELLIKFKKESFYIYHRALSKKENLEGESYINYAYPDDLLIKSVYWKNYIVLFYEDHSRLIEINYIFTKKDVETIVQQINSKKSTGVHIYVKSMRTYLWYPVLSSSGSHNKIPDFLS